MTFLGTSIVYALFSLLILIIVTGCQPHHYDIKEAGYNQFPTVPHIPKKIEPLHNSVSQNTIHKAVKPIIVVEQERERRPEQNILQNMFSNDTGIALITNKQKQIPLKWQSITQFYKKLPKNRQQEIYTFYKAQNFKPVWFDDKGHLTNQATQMQTLLNEEIFLTTPISTEFIKINPNVLQSNDEILHQDLAFTLRALSAFEIIRNGLTPLRGITLDMGISENNGYKPFDLMPILNNILLGNVNQEIINLTTFHKQYVLLRHEMKRLNYIKNKGGYVQVPSGQFLKVGMHDPKIPLIRKRMNQLGFVTSHVISDKYDSYLQTQIKSFQKSRGIKVDGVIGTNVYKAFKETINQHIKAVLVNIERIRRTPIKSSDQMQIWVNVPEMRLQVIAAQKNILSMKTIVGRKDRPTPIFNDIIEYIDFNPYWHVPYSLATKDILPKLKRNPSYGKRKGIKIYRKNRAINPRAVNWKNYSETNFPFSVRQEPGKNNALGTVKFIFPNKHAVYLHDTPAKNRFNQTSRFLSSGCVRVEQPQDLAMVLLKKQLSSYKVKQIFKAQKNKAVYLSPKIPVYIEYLTTFVDDNMLNIRPDIYDYDQNLLNALIKTSQKPI